jgi:hypothetical protein
MKERMSRRDWPRLKIELGNELVERHRNDKDSIQRAQVRRRAREAAEHGAELANPEAPLDAATSPTTVVAQSDQATQLDAGRTVVGRHVTVRYPGPNGVTTLHSYVTDVSLDGDAVEVAAAVGHLVSLDNVTFDDLDDTGTPPAGSVSDEPKARWGPPDLFAPPGYLKPLGPPGMVSLDVWRAADARRRGPEIGYGDFWTFDDPNDWYSIAWNAATGELYTYRQKDRTVLVRAVIPQQEDVDTVLLGWERDQYDAGSGYPVCGRIASRASTGTPPAEPSPHPARDISNGWHHRPPPTPAEPPLGLA